MDIRVPEMKSVSKTDAGKLAEYTETFNDYLRFYKDALLKNILRR